ncbi:MAG: hypothetical protein ABW134_17625 [Candidatus Thiodiazotropha endolucinida]
MSDKDNAIHVLGWEKWRVGWLDETGDATGKTLTRVAKPTVATPIVDSDYTISATDADSDTVKLVAIEVGDRLYYTAEYRRQSNLDTDLPDAGVVITKANEHINQGEGPVIVQESDVTAGNLDDAPFTINAPRNLFDDIGSGVNIEVTSMDANEAQIRLNYALPPTENDVYVSDINERWKSEDVWVDAPDVGGNFEADPLAVIDTDEQPVVGELNKVYGRVRNQGHADATNFEVHLEIREPWGAGGPWRSLRIENVPLLQGTDTDDPALPNTQVAVVYTAPDGTTQVHYVTTDEHGCYVDTLSVAEPGRWETEVVLEEDDCREGAAAPTGTVEVPPTLCGGPLWCCWILLVLVVAVIATLLWLARLLCGIKSATLPFLIALLVTILLIWLILARCDVMLGWLLLVIGAAILLTVLIICFTRLAPCFGSGRESTRA